MNKISYKVRIHKSKNQKVGLGVVPLAELLLLGITGKIFAYCLHDLKLYISRGSSNERNYQETQ
jgi:hypothetical protein